MDLSKVNKKFKTLFARFKEPGYILNNYYADGLINKLYQYEDSEIQQVEKQSIVADLLLNALNDIEKLHITVQVFLMRILGAVARNELHFCKIVMLNKENVTKYMMDINKAGHPHSLTVALLEIALSLVRHSSGISYLLEIGVWKEILCLCNEPKTIFIVRQMYKFSNAFLWNVNDMGDETLMLNVLDFILKPIMTSELCRVTSITSEEEIKVIKLIEPVTQILLSLFSDAKRIHQPSFLIEALIQRYNIQNHISVVCNLIHENSARMLISKLYYWLANCKVFMSKPLTDDAVYDSTDLVEVTVSYYNTMHYYLNRRKPMLVLDYTYFCHVVHTQIWIDYKQHASKDSSVAKVTMGYFVIPLVTVIAYVLLRTHVSGKQAFQERLNVFVHKIYYCTSEQASRAAYGLRDLLAEMDVVPIALQGMKFLSVMTKNLTNDQANLIFQGVTLILFDYDPKDESGEHKVEEDYDADDKINPVVTHVVEVVYTLVKNYDISWQHSLEVLCLYSVMSSILTRQNLSCQFIVKSLNLISITIKKFLPPNLSLLLELNPKTSINDIGDLIYKKLHDRNWEIRDSALELLHVCTEISFIKYPPFQSQIMSNKLLEVAVTMVFNDHKYYVQASAIKCIAAASKIGAIWGQVLESHPDVKEKLLALVYESQEGVVRKEAIIALSAMYQNFKMSDSFKQELYQQFASAALSDFHWEVQIAALQFWRMAIHSALTEQGMLDGVFPSVTFSKESRKIVTLNETEIQRRIMKALQTLSNIGCLTVLVKLLQDDTELEVMKHAYNVTNDLSQILIKYKFNEIDFKDDMDIADVEIEVKNKPFTEEMQQQSSESKIKSDEIIESILNDSDINILSNIYKIKLSEVNETNNTECKPKLENIESTPKVKIIKNISPNLFVNFLEKKEFLAVIDEKNRWKQGIRSISSLLDDVLGIYEDNEEINTMDCY